MIDLHFHSSISDGKLTPEEVANRIRVTKMRTCALTDHDTVDGVLAFKSALAGTGINVINGVELTALFEEYETHLIAYGFELEPMRNVLLRRKNIVDSMKIQELIKTTEAFQHQGFQVNDSLQVDPKLPVGYIVARDVYRNPTNHQKLLSNTGTLLGPEEFYTAYQAPGKPCHVPRSGVTFDWIKEHIKPLVGDLIVAHPRVKVSFSSRKLDSTNLLRLIQGGCTGVEVYHAHTNDQETEELNNIVRERGLSYTGGSDSHGKKDDTPYGEYGEGRVVPAIKLGDITYD